MAERDLRCSAYYSSYYFLSHSLSISILFLSTPYFPLYATFLPVTGILYSVFFTTHNFESFHSSSSRIYVGADPALQLYHTYTSPKGTSSIITSTGMAAFKLVAENCGGLHWQCGHELALAVAVSYICKLYIAGWVRWGWGSGSSGGTIHSWLCLKLQILLY